MPKFIQTNKNNPQSPSSVSDSNKKLDQITALLHQNNDLISTIKSTEVDYNVFQIGRTIIRLSKEVLTTDFTRLMTWVLLITHLETEASTKRIKRTKYEETWFTVWAWFERLLHLSIAITTTTVTSLGFHYALFHFSPMEIDRIHLFKRISVVSIGFRHSSP